METIIYKTLLGLLLVVRRMANINGIKDSVNDVDYLLKNLREEHEKHETSRRCSY